MKLTATLIGVLALEGAHAFTSSKRPAFARSSCRAATATVEGRKTVGEFQPSNNFMLIKKAPVQEKTESGILLTGDSKIEKTEGTVIKTGPGKNHPESGIVVPIPVEEGDGIVYGRYDGVEIDYNGGKHSLIRDSDILVKFKGDLSLDSVEVVRDKVLVAVKQDVETSGGLLLGSTSGSKVMPSTGTVTKIGPGKMSSSGDPMPMDVSIGDVVKFRDYAGNEVTIGEDEFRVVEMVDILAKF